MSNARVGTKWLNEGESMSNQIQSSREMPKQVRHDKSVMMNSFQIPILNFDIPLTFGF